jgi:hypothetical protein
MPDSCPFVSRNGFQVTQWGGGWAGEGMEHYTDFCSLWALKTSPPNVGFDFLPSTALKVLT